MGAGGVMAGNCWQSGCRNGDGVVGDDDGPREAVAVGGAGGLALLSDAWEAPCCSQLQDEGCPRVRVGRGAELGRTPDCAPQPGRSWD